MSIALVDNAGGEHYVSGSTNTSSAVQNSGVVSVIVPSNLQAGQYRVVIKTTVGNQNYVAQSNSYVTIVGFQNQVS